VLNPESAVKCSLLMPSPYPPVLFARFPEDMDPQSMLWVVTEKVHGSNFGFWGRSRAPQPPVATVETCYSGMKDVCKTKSFRCQDSGTRVYQSGRTTLRASVACGHPPEAVCTGGTALSPGIE
jgi:hypothetical protein